MSADLDESALLFYYWNFCRERKRETEEEKDFFFPNDNQPCHIPSIIFVTMAPPPAIPVGRRSGASNYGIEETTCLLDIMERILPIGPDEWKRVVDEHSITYCGRTLTSIRRRYQTLYRKQAPTGSPNMPEDVRQAKRIKHKIGNKAMLGDGQEEFDLEVSFKTVEEECCSKQTLPEELPLQETSQQPQPTQLTQEKPLLDVAGSTITPSKRSYIRSGTPTNNDAFLRSLQLSLEDRRLQRETDEKRWEREREEREKDRRAMMNMIGMAVTSLSTAWTSGNTNASAVLVPGQAPIFERRDEQVVTDTLDHEDEEDEDIPRRKRAAVGPVTTKRTTKRKRGLGIASSSSLK
jgi:hypothetical protein